MAKQLVTNIKNTMKQKCHNNNDTMFKYSKTAEIKKKKKFWRDYTSFLKNGEQIVSAPLKSNCKNIYVASFHDDAN